MTQDNARTRFAGVAGANKDSLFIGFWLKRKADSPRFIQVNSPMSNNWVYKLRIMNAKELDEELLGWLKEAYEVGCRDTKDKLIRFTLREGETVYERLGVTQRVGEAAVRGKTGKSWRQWVSYWTRLVPPRCLTRR